MLTKLKPSQVSAIQRLAVTAEWAEFKSVLASELDELKDRLIECENPALTNRLQGAAVAIRDVIDIENSLRR